MAKIKQGILGGVTGSISNVVGSSWKGKAVIKSKPLSVSNPRTAGQVAQRTKMSNIVAFSREILTGIIKPCWDRFAVGESGYNAFVKENIALFPAAMPSPAANLVISKGKMGATPISGNECGIGTALVVVQWSDDSGSGFKTATDTAMVVVVNVTQGVVGVSSAVAVRSESEVTVFMPSNIGSLDVLHIYLAFRRADGTVVSNTSNAVGIVV
jgi:hypothetical protein